MTTLTINHFYGKIMYTLNVTEEIKELQREKFPTPYFTKPIDGNIDDYTVGSVATLKALVSNFEMAEATNGKKFLKGAILTPFKKVNFKVWDNKGEAFKLQELFSKVKAVKVYGKVSEFPAGVKQIDISDAEPLGGNADEIFSLLPATEVNMQEYTWELLTYIHELESPYKEMGLYALEKFWHEFSVKPAALNHHHAYLGGLLKHTVGLLRVAKYILEEEGKSFDFNVMRLIKFGQNAALTELWEKTDYEKWNLTWRDSMDFLSESYNEINGLKNPKEYNDYLVANFHEPDKNIIILGILLHDMGKVFEYFHAGESLEKFKLLYPTADLEELKHIPRGAIGMDPVGVLDGHVPTGAEIFKDILSEMNISMPISKIMEMNNALKGHHGKLEWGSPTKPMSVSAKIVNLADFFDSRWEKDDEVN